MKLAINGGKPIREKVEHPFPNTDDNDLKAVVSCFERNSFSAFRAGSYDGGVMVQEFEKNTREKLSCKHAVAFDTWSNGIVAGLMAIGVEPGDEVIITPYTMTSCATSILSCGALPVFADVCKDSGCLDPEDVRRKITDRTKAIFVVHLFGIPADMDKIMEIANEHNLFVFEDCAQAPMAIYKGQYCGTIGDIGGLSFTESKHIMSGEGGIAITNNDLINNGLRVVRNHGEVLDTCFSKADYATEVIPSSGLVGFNFRMTELSAALASSQLLKLDDVLCKKRKLSNIIIEGLSDIPFITPMIPEYEHTPSWYNLPLRFNQKIAGVERDKLVAALNAEGFNFAAGYVVPLYYQSIYRDKPHWAIKSNKNRDIDYTRVCCKNVEDLWKKELITTLDIRAPFTENDMHDIVKAFNKVADNIKEIR